MCDMYLICFVFSQHQWQCILCHVVSALIFTPIGYIHNRICVYWVYTRFARCASYRGQESVLKPWKPAWKLQRRCRRQCVPEATQSRQPQARCCRPCFDSDRLDASWAPSFKRRALSASNSALAGSRQQSLLQSVNRRQPVSPRSCSARRGDTLESAFAASWMTSRPSSSCSDVSQPCVRKKRTVSR